MHGQPRVRVRVAPWALGGTKDGEGSTTPVNRPRNKSNFRQTAAHEPHDPLSPVPAPSRLTAESLKRVSWLDGHTGRSNCTNPAIYSSAPGPNTAPATSVGCQGDGDPLPLPRNLSLSDALLTGAPPCNVTPGEHNDNTIAGNLSVSPGGPFDDTRACALNRLQAAVEDCYNMFATRVDGGMPCEIDPGHTARCMRAEHVTIGSAAQKAGGSILPTPAFLPVDPGDDHATRDDARHSIPRSDQLDDLHFAANAAPSSTRTSHLPLPRSPPNAAVLAVPLTDNMSSETSLHAAPAAVPIRIAPGSGITLASLACASVAPVSPDPPRIYQGTDVLSAIGPAGGRAPCI